MHTKRGFRDENFQLPELAEEIRFELGDIVVATAAAKVDDSHDADEVEIQLIFALPDPAQGKFSLLCGQAFESRKQSALEDHKFVILNCPAVVIG